MILNLNNVHKPEEVIQQQVNSQKEARRLRLEQNQESERKSLKERQAREEERQKERQSLEKERLEQDNRLQPNANALCNGCAHAFRHTSDSRWDGPNLQIRCCAPWLGNQSLSVSGVKACNGFVSGPFVGTTASAPTEVQKGLEQDPENIQLPGTTEQEDDTSNQPEAEPTTEVSPNEPTAQTEDEPA